MSGSITATTLAYTSLALAAAGTAAGVAGQMQSASAAKASADYQAQVAAGNQKIALDNASAASKSGEAQAAIQEQKTRAQVGVIESAQGASGVDINSPTASAVRTSAAELGDLDVQTIRSNAARKAYGYQTEAANFGNQSSVDTSTGENAEIAGYIGAGTGVLKSAASASTNYASVMGKASGLNTGYTDAERGGLDNLVNSID